MKKRRKDFKHIEVGSRFGRWTVIGDGDYRLHKGGATHLLLCRCDCGAERLVRKQNLCNGQSRSCGCQIAEVARRQMKGRAPTNKMPPGMAARNRVLYSYKRNAHLRNIEWSLTDSYCFTIFSEPCHYCGIELAQAHTGAPGATTFRYNGIDRIDNSVGYVEGNVVACCEMCNKAKNKHSLEYFLAWVRRVYSHSVGKVYP